MTKLNILITLADRRVVLFQMILLKCLKFLIQTIFIAKNFILIITITPK